MATYEYQCQPCAIKRTEQHPIEKAHPNPKCPNCKAVMSRVYNSPALSFKGTGWAHKERKNRK